MINFENLENDVDDIYEGFEIKAEAEGVDTIDSFYESTDGVDSDESTLLTEGINFGGLDEDGGINSLLESVGDEVEEDQITLEEGTDIDDETDGIFTIDSIQTEGGISFNFDNTDDVEDSIVSEDTTFDNPEIESIQLIESQEDILESMTTEEIELVQGALFEELKEDAEAHGVLGSLTEDDTMLITESLKMPSQTMRIFSKEDELTRRTNQLAMQKAKKAGSPDFVQYQKFLAKAKEFKAKIYKKYGKSDTVRTASKSLKAFTRKKVNMKKSMQDIKKVNKYLKNAK